MNIQGMFVPICNFGSAMICELFGDPVFDHFVGVNKMVDLGSGIQHEGEGVKRGAHRC